MYPNDLETDLVQELLHFQSYLSSERILIKPISGSLISLSSFLQEQNLGNIYPNLDIALRMALCTPAANCSGERSFSCLKRVKNYLRSTLSQEKLNALALLCIESELINKISYDDIINDFWRLIKISHVSGIPKMPITKIGKRLMMHGLASAL
ncbi:unnamed protein product [Colias eurytheme]|nr:unnamed protein product [Colias eurytheme]